MKIILTGGGTAGHVIPNLALLPALKKAGFEAHYIGSKTGMERGIVESAGLPYHGISSGKLRRYFDLRNFTDAFRVVKGIGDAAKIIRKIKPDIIFSKGGFVVVPVLAAARLCGVKAVIHESDITPGLANKLIMPIAAKICVSFPETVGKLSAKNRAKAVVTGTPIRKSIYNGDRLYGLKKSGFEPSGKPVVLVTGGSQGSAAINRAIREILPTLMQKFRVIHLCGRGNLLNTPMPDYAEYEYVTDIMPDILAAADIVISRAGANTLFELLALNKPNLLIPLPLGQSRGDQILNAESFKNQGFSIVLPEDEINPQTLLQSINTLYSRRNEFITNMQSHQSQDGIAAIMDIIQKTVL